MTDATISIEAAIALLPPNKPTTLDRMRDAAFAEVARIEGSQVARMVAGFIGKPEPAQITKRDDFFGMVRMIDVLMSDPALLARLLEVIALRRQPVAAVPAEIADAVVIDADTEVDA
jgi:hypothetical protein